MTLLDDQAPATATRSPGRHWVDVCDLADLVPDRGVCALVEGAPVALFRCSPDDDLYAVGNLDPYSGASVMSRGLVGSVGDRPVVASPLYKNRFDLRTGASLDDPDVRIPCHRVRVEGGRLLVAVTPGPDEKGAEIDRA
jgi:nitrite reductase (NADH) small subunit